uniref:G-protein coupled receptors family 1 profile domain-containing protein n=1 Tax=Junco hyemalis TaxID=40217 RepID=A0A8C5INY0_JUNHY
MPPAPPASLCSWRDSDPTVKGNEEWDILQGRNVSDQKEMMSQFYIINLAFANFSFLHFVVLSTLLYLLEELSCYTIVPLVFMRALFPLLFFSYNLGLYLLTAISIDRCTSILCPLWYRCRCPQRLSWVVCALLWALCITVIVTMTALCQSREHDHCQVSLITMYALNLFLFAPAMLISSTILLIKFKCGSQQQQPKRLDIVIFLVVLSFLLFALPLSLSNFLQQLGYTVVSSQVLFLLACIHSSTNPIIYLLVGRFRRPCSVGSLRLSLQRVFEEGCDREGDPSEAAQQGWGQGGRGMAGGEVRAGGGLDQSSHPD